MLIRIIPSVAVWRRFDSLIWILCFYCWIRNVDIDKRSLEFELLESLDIIIERLFFQVVRSRSRQFVRSSCLYNFQFG